MNRKNIRFVVGSGIAIGFCAWAIWVMLDRWHQLPVIRLDFFPVALAIVLAWAVVAINSSLVEYIAKRVGSGLGQRTAQRLGIIVTLFNYFLPMRAGMALRLISYVRKAGQDVVRLGAAMFAAALIVQAVSVLVLLLCVFAIRDVEWPVMLAVLAAWFAVVIVSWWAGTSGLGAKGILGHFLARVRPGLEALLRTGYRPFLVVLIFSLAILAVTALRFQLVMSLASTALPFATAIALAAGAGLASLVSVTFGGLGVREAGVVVVGTYCGLSAESCLLMALLDRAIVSFGLVLIGVPVLLREHDLKSLLPR